MRQKEVRREVLYDPFNALNYCYLSHYKDVKCDFGILQTRFCGNNCVQGMGSENDENVNSSLQSDTTNDLHERAPISANYLIAANDRFRDFSYFMTVPGGRNAIVDFVLAFEKSQTLENKSAARAENLNSRYRKHFVQKLQEVGFAVELDETEWIVDGKRICFLKISASTETLKEAAQLYSVRAPVALMENERDISFIFPKTSLMKMFFSKFLKILNDSVPNKQFYFTALYDRKRENLFLINKDGFMFQDVTDRIRMTWNVIEGIQVDSAICRSKELKARRKFSRNFFSFLSGEDEVTKLSIHWFLEHRVFTAAYPLHDSCYAYETGKDPFAQVPVKRLPERYWLYKYWASWKAWRYLQPLDDIKAYFGVQYAMYFAFLGAYSKALAIPAVVGLIAAIYGISVTARGSDTIYFFCNKTLDYKIIDPPPPHSRGRAPVLNRRDKYTDVPRVCRLCLSELCPFHERTASCHESKISVAVDHDGAAFYAFLVCVWAIIFLATLKRKQCLLAHRWDVGKSESDTKKPRAKFTTQVLTKRLDPITGEHRPYLQTKEKARRLVQSVLGVLFYLIVLLGFVISIATYRTLSVGLYKKAAKSNGGTSYGLSTISHFVASVLISFVIILLSAVYGKAAVVLTNFERPFSDNDYLRSHLSKVFIFEFINNYGSLFYLAFIKGKRYYSMVKMPADADFCPMTGCLQLVTIQLATFFTLKQIVGIISQIIIPYLRSRHMRKKTGKLAQSNLSRAAQDYLLLQESDPAMFQDYLELVIQYGLVVLFAAAFPLGPLFALLNNLINIRVDANKLLTEHRRPIPKRVRSIGPWLNILVLLTKFAVFTNALMIALSSDFIDRWVYRLLLTQKAAIGYWFYNVVKYTTDEMYGEESLLKDNEDVCIYRGYLNDAARLKTEWYVTWAARVAFILTFQVSLLALSAIVHHCLPKLPKTVKHHLQRRNIVLTNLNTNLH